MPTVAEQSKSSNILEEEKQRAIKNFFAEVSEDKFTQVKRASLNYLFKQWKYFRIQDAAFPPEATAFKSLVGASPVAWASAELKMDIDYRHLENVDGVFFTFYFKGVDYKWPGMEGLDLYFIVDGSKRYKFEERSGHEFDSKVETSALNTTEFTQIKVPISDFIDIANASKIEYRLSFGSINLEGTLDSSELTLIRGFYNNVFDETFAIDELYEFVIAEKKAKASSNSSASSKNGDSGGCYIATAVYGDYNHPNVMELRKFRDQYLLPYTAGKILVDIYYKLSPTVANSLKNKKRTNNIVRMALEKIVAFIGRSKKK
jgi:hypothetical protein